MSASPSNARWAQRMTVLQLKKELRSAGVSTPTRALKAQLVDLYVKNKEAEERQVQQQQQRQRQEQSVESFNGSITDRSEREDHDEYESGEETDRTFLTDDDDDSCSSGDDDDVTDVYSSEDMDHDDEDSIYQEKIQSLARERRSRSMSVAAYVSHSPKFSSTKTKYPFIKSWRIFSLAAVTGYMKRLVIFVLAAAMVALIISGTILLLFSKHVDVIYCNTDTSIHPFESPSMDPSELAKLTPCTPCPGDDDNSGKCIGGRLMCFNEYLETHGRCIPDRQLQLAATEMVKHIEHYLASIRGLYECEQLNTFNVTKEDLRKELETLNLHISDRFDECFNKAIRELQESVGTTETVSKNSVEIHKGPDGSLVFRSTTVSKPLICLFKEGILLCCRFIAPYVAGLAFIMIIVWIIISRLNASSRKRILVDTMMDTIFTDLMNSSIVVVARERSKVVHYRHANDPFYQDAWNEAVSLIQCDQRIKAGEQLVDGQICAVWEWLDITSPTRGVDQSFHGTGARDMNRYHNGSNAYVHSSTTFSPEPMRKIINDTPSSLYPPMPNFSTEFTED